MNLKLIEDLLSSKGLLDIMGYIQLGIAGFLVIIGIVMYVKQRKNNKPLTKAYILGGLGLAAFINPILHFIGLY